MNKRGFGSQGEALARDYLQRKGARILEMNYRRPTGEIDIIARQKRTLLFVEVKRRSSLRFGRPAEAVDRVFTPEMAEDKRKALLRGWDKAVKCALLWGEDASE